jgi:hypothetical protein
MTTPALAENVKGRGRHYRHPVSGELVPSVTNVIGILDKPALPRWAARETAKAAWSMRASLESLGQEEAIDVLKGAPWRRSGRAADRGTSIHEWLESSLLGEPLPTLTGEALEYVDAAAAWLERWQPVAIATEVTMFAATYAGTADAILTIEDETWLIDFKTSSGLYPEVALQLAALADCPTSIVGGDPQDTVPIDRLGAVRIGKSGEWEMREIVYPAQSLDGFYAALNLWAWKHADNPLGRKMK